MPEATDGKFSKIRIQINYVGFNVLFQWGFFFSFVIYFE